jgi:hypothetical protein
MFTVKVVYSDFSESVWQTRSVTTRAMERAATNEPLAMQGIWFQEEGGAEMDLSGAGATVYVMNDSGKTVARYTLGRDEPSIVSGE